MVRPATLRDHFQFDPPNCDLGSRADPEPVPDPLQVAVGGPLGLTAAWRSPELIKPWTIRSTTSRCRRISRAASHGWVPTHGSPIQLQKRVLKSGTHPGVLPGDHLCRPLLAWLQRRRSACESNSRGKVMYTSVYELEKMAQFREVELEQALRRRQLRDAAGPEPR